MNQPLKNKLSLGLKKVFKSEILRFVLSAILIYWAYKHFDVGALAKQLIGVKWWFVLVNIFISYLSSILISYRWSLLLMKKTNLKDVLIFFKSSLAASFYGLFFPTSAVADFFKWIIIDDKYPQIPKSKLLMSVGLDRFVGLSMFLLTGSVMLLIAKINGILVPIEIQLVVLGLFLGCICFYIALMFFDLTRIWKIKWLKRFEDMADLIKKENAGQILKAALISLVSQFFWILQAWFISWYFGTNLSLVSLFIYLPIISLILVLPISFAGFGAREQLYLFFFTATAASQESLLLMSTFSGVLGVITCLLGGLVTLTPEFKKYQKKTKD